MVGKEANQQLRGNSLPTVASRVLLLCAEHTAIATNQAFARVRMQVEKLTVGIFSISGHWERPRSRNGTELRSLVAKIATALS